MAYSFIRQDNDISYDVVELVINTRNDLTDLPVNFHSGSTVICLEDSSVFMLSVDNETGVKEWREL